MCVCVCVCVCVCLLVLKCSCGSLFLNLPLKAVLNWAWTRCSRAALSVENIQACGLVLNWCFWSWRAAVLKGPWAGARMLKMLPPQDMGASFWLVELVRDGGEETKKRLWLLRFCNSITDFFPKKSVSMCSLSNLSVSVVSMQFWTLVRLATRVEEGGGGGVALKGAVQDIYNLLTAPQNCLHHVRSGQGTVVCKQRARALITFNMSYAEIIKRWRRGGNRGTRRKPVVTSFT